MPAPTDQYFEIEVAKLHGGWAVWRLFSAQVKAILMAHEWHKNMREHYQYDVGRASGETSVARPQAPWDAARDQFFGGKPPGKN